MDGASEAETAASLHTSSDAAPTVNSATFTDPNSSYPHPQSLRSPMGIAPERNSGEDIANQYVTAKASELRVMNAHGAKEMADYLDENFEQVVEFVRMHRLYDNMIFKPSAGTGSGRNQRILFIEHIPKEGGGGDFSQVPINPFPHLLPNQLVQHYSKSVKGDGHCLWRTMSVEWFETELYWEHFRLVISSYGQVENPVLEMHGARQTYDEFKIDDSGGNFNLPFSYMTNMLAGEDPDAHPSMFEIALASKFFATKFVTVIDYQRHTLNGGVQAIIANPTTVIDQGLIGSISQRNGDRFPNIEEAYWMINSCAGRNEQGQEVYHWDAVIPRVVDKSRDALETTEEFIIDSIRKLTKPASKGDFGPSGTGKSGLGQGAKGLPKGAPPSKGAKSDWMVMQGGRRIPMNIATHRASGFSDEFSPTPTPQHPTSRPESSMSKKPAGTVQFDSEAKTQEKRTAPRRGAYPQDPPGGKPPVFRSDSHMVDFMEAKRRGTTSEEQRTKGYFDVYGHEPTFEERRKMLKGSVRDQHGGCVAPTSDGSELTDEQRRQLLRGPGGLLTTGGKIPPTPEHLVASFYASEKYQKGKIGQVPQMRPSVSQESNLYKQAVDASRAWRALNAKGDQKTAEEQRDQIIAETQHQLAAELARHTLHGSHADHASKLQFSDAEIGEKAVELLREQGPRYANEELGKKARQLLHEKTDAAKARLAARGEQTEEASRRADKGLPPRKVSQFAKTGGRIRDAQEFSARLSSLKEPPSAPRSSPVSKLDLERDIPEPPVPPYVPGDWGESASKKPHPLDRFRNDLEEVPEKPAEVPEGKPAEEPSPKDDFSPLRPDKKFGAKKHKDDLTPELIQTNVPGLREQFEWGYQDGPLPLRDGREIQVYEPHLDPTKRSQIDYEDEEEVDLFGDNEDDDSQNADPFGAFEEAAKGLSGNPGDHDGQHWPNSQQWYIGDNVDQAEDDEYDEGFWDTEWRQAPIGGWKGDEPGYRDHGTGYGSEEWWQLHPHNQSVGRFANVDFGQNRSAWDGHESFRDSRQPIRPQRRDDQSSRGRDGKQGRGLPAEEGADPGSPDGQPPRKLGTPGPGGDDPPPQSGVDSEQKDERPPGGDKSRKPREGGGPPSDPEDPSDDDGQKPEDEEPVDQPDDDAIRRRARLALASKTQRVVAAYKEEVQQRSMLLHAHVLVWAQDGDA